MPFENTPENARQILKNLGQNIDAVAGIFDESLLKGTTKITLIVSGKKYKKASTYVKISVQSRNSQTGQNPSDGGNSQTGQEPIGKPEKATEYVNENTLVRDVMNDPILKDYGRLLFPVDQTISSSLTLGKVENILTWYRTAVYVRRSLI